MTEQQTDRDRLRRGAESALACGTFDAEVIGAVPQILDHLGQAEADRDRLLRSSRLAKEGRIKANARADQAGARTKAGRDLPRPCGNTLTGLYVCTACDQPCPCPTTRALESVPPPHV